jgi:hypothetical protein
VHHRVGGIITLCLALSFAAGVEPASAQAIPTLTYHVIARYGATDSAAATGADSRALIGRAHDVAEGPGGVIYVGDQAANRIIVFDEAGAVQRVIGRAGEGPGEFRLISAMSTGADGSLYVWDARLRRLTHFATDGRFVSQVVVPGGPSAGMTVAAGRIWFVQLKFTPAPGVKAFDLGTGAVADSFAPLTPTELAINHTGNIGAITHDNSGRVVFASAVPLVLRTWSAGTERDIGSVRFPDAKVTALPSGVSVAPVSVRSVAVLPDGHFAVVYGHADRSDPATGIPVQAFRLAVLDRGGQVVGEAALPDGPAPKIASTANGDLLMTVNSDVAQVWRIRLDPPPRH